MYGRRSVSVFGSVYGSILHIGSTLVLWVGYKHSNITHANLSVLKNPNPKLRFEFRFGFGFIGFSVFGFNFVRPTKYKCEKY